MRMSMSVSAIPSPHAGEIASTHASDTDRVKVHQISHAFRTADGVGVPIFEHLDFSVRSGEIVSIVGRSGAGKSTLFNLVSGLIKPQSGHISVGMREDGSAGRIAYMLQKDLLMPWRTVLQNAVLGIELYRKVKPADY